MTRLGQILGIDVADSELMVCSGQLRFMSRYFLEEGEILTHGAQLLGTYLADDTFVEKVRDQGAKAERGLLTFQEFCTAVKAAYPNDHDRLLVEFVRMIGFDALIGNQDRHAFNWGVITHLTKNVTPRFSPIYDTARGLFWNSTEDELVKFDQEETLSAYVRRSRPLIGWDGWPTAKGELTHFDLIEAVSLSNNGAYMGLLDGLGKVAVASIRRCEGMIDAEFGRVMSPKRCDLVKRCLRMRFARYDQIFSGK